MHNLENNEGKSKYLVDLNNFITSVSHLGPDQTKNEECKCLALLVAQISSLKNVSSMTRDRIEELKLQNLLIINVL